MDEKKRKKLMKFDKFAKKGIFGVIEYVFGLEDKVDALSLVLAETIALAEKKNAKGDKGDTYVLTEEDRKAIFTSLLGSFDKQEIINSVMESIDFAKIANGIKSKKSKKIDIKTLKKEILEELIEHIPDVRDGVDAEKLSPEDLFSAYKEYFDEQIGELVVLPEDTHIQIDDIKKLIKEGLGGSTARNLHQLFDINVNGVTDGDSLFFNESTQKWVSRNPSGLARVDFFMLNEDSEISTYQSVTTDIDDPRFIGGTETTFTTAVTGSSQLIESWITDENVVDGIIDSTEIQLQFRVSKDSGNRGLEVFYELYKRDQGGTETLIGTSEVMTITNTSLQRITFNNLIPSTELEITDRLLWKVIASKIGSGGNVNIKFGVEGSIPSRLIVPIPVNSITHNILQGRNVDDTHPLSSITDATLAGLSSLSTDLAKSLYTMTTGIDVEFEDATNATILYLDEENVRVGIGTDTPVQKFDVNGIIGIGGVRVLYDAETLDNFSGSLFIGDGGSFLQTGFFQGINNTSLGHRALEKITIGLGNTSVGRDSGREITSGVNNTTFGNRAGGKIKTGNSNLAIGNISLENIVGTDENVAIGVLALSSTSGLSEITGNVAIGHESGRNIRTGGDFNTFIGWEAGKNTSTGSRNILIGKGIEAISPTENDHLNIGDIIFGQLDTGNVGIGNSNPKSTLDINGSLGLKIQRNTTTTTIDDTAYQWNGDTNLAGFSYTLPVGVQNRTYKIVNVGTSGNQLEVIPNGTENLLGVNSSFILNDGESLIIGFDTTDNWY